MRAGNFSKGAGKVALGGILTALALVFLYLSAFVPTGQVGIAAVAGLFPMAGVISAGISTGLFCWAAAGILAMILVPAKGTVLLFLLFLGIYPVAKSLIERLKNLILEWIIKLLVFNADLLLCLNLVGALLMGSVPQQLQELWLFWPAANVVFVVYDIGLSKLAAAYRERVDRQLRK